MDELVARLRCIGDELDAYEYSEIYAAADEIERLRDYIAKHNELVKNMTIELAEYQVKEHKVGIKRAGLAKLGADKGEV